MHSNQQQEEQNFITQKSQLQLKHEYWQKWIQWVDQVRKQRYSAIKMLKYQNQMEQRLLKNTFKAWLQIHQQEKFEQLIRLKNSLRQQQQQLEQQQLEQQQLEQQQLEQQQQQQTQVHHQKKPQFFTLKPSQNDQDNNSSYKMNLAIRFHSRKTYAKCITAWIGYIIACKKFQHQLSKTYINFLLKKYFDIIHEFKCKSRDKKAKKAQTTINNSPIKQDLNQNAQFQMNYVTPSHLISQVDKFPNTSHNFRQLLHQNPTFKRTQPQQAQSSTFYHGFQRNAVLGESRRSQFSTMSAQLDYNSKRKFRPITELPSIPDLQNISKQLTPNKGTIKQQKRSPIKSYKPQQQQKQQQQKSIQKIASSNNLTQSNLTQSNQSQSHKIKQKIVQILIKEKLLTLEIMKGEQFESGLEYENYSEKTINTLRKLKDIKIR